MSFRAFRSFPSKKWFIENIDQSTLLHCFLALRVTLIKNCLLYIHGIQIIGSDVDLAEKIEHGELRRSFNPLRHIGSGLVFSYWHAWRTAWYRGNDERLAELQRWYMSNFFGPANLALIRKTYKKADQGPLRIPILKGDELIWWNPQAGTSRSLKEPNLARELIICATRHVSKPNDEFKPILVGGDVYLEYIGQQLPKSPLDGSSRVIVLE